MEPANTQSTQSFQKLLTEIIQKELCVLGPTLTFEIIKTIPGLTVSETGEVTQISGDPQPAAQQLIEKFTNLSQPLAKKILQPILARSFVPQGQPVVQPAMETSTENVRLNSKEPG